MKAFGEYQGVGFGEGSLGNPDPADPARLVKQLPDNKRGPFDFHLRPGSPLIAAGVDAGLKEDADGNARPANTPPGISPYEADGSK